MHEVSTKWIEGMHFTSSPSGGKVEIDAVAEHGGKEKGVRPKALMLSSLAGCTGIDVMSILEKMRVFPESFEIVVQAELTEEHPKFYKSTHIIYKFKGDIDIEKLNKAVDLSYNKYCGVIHMFKQFSEVSKEIILNS